MLALRFTIFLLYYSSYFFCYDYQRANFATTQSQNFSTGSLVHICCTKCFMQLVVCTWRGQINSRARFFVFSLVNYLFNVTAGTIGVFCTVQMVLLREPCFFFRKKVLNTFHKQKKAGYEVPLINSWYNKFFSMVAPFLSASIYHILKNTE